MKNHKSRIKLIFLNKYSWLLIVVYILASYVMGSFYRTNFLQGFFISLPLVMLVIFLCQISADLTISASKKHHSTNMFIKNILLITYCFLFGSILFVIFNRNNPDVGGWWPLFLYVMYFYGLIFSLIFSLISYCLNYYNLTYNSFFYAMIILSLSILKIFPPYIEIPYLGKIDILFIILSTLLMTHLLLTILLKFLDTSYAK